MKKLRKLNLKSATLMNDNEMKMIVGGSSGNGCPAQSSTCSGTCTINFNGEQKSGTCKQMWVVSKYLCACEQNT
jgi:natural product precursor